MDKVDPYLKIWLADEGRTEPFPVLIMVLDNWKPEAEGLTLLSEEPLGNMYVGLVTRQAIEILAAHKKVRELEASR